MMIEQIIARLRAEYAESSDPLEIARCLAGCVAAKKLIEFALAHSSEIEEELDRQERQDDWDETEFLKLDDRDITTEYP